MSELTQGLSNKQEPFDMDYCCYENWPHILIGRETTVKLYNLEFSYNYCRVSIYRQLWTFKYIFGYYHLLVGTGVVIKVIV